MIFIFTVILLTILIIFVQTDSGKYISLDKAKEVKTQEPSETQEILVSAESGFYDEKILLEVSSAMEGAIYYTTDGSEPDVNNTDSTYLYEAPLELIAEDEEAVRTYKFKTFHSDGTQSDTLTNTYFMGKKIESRYDTLVVSITAENDDLYGYENGIFVEGKLREEWLTQHSGEEIVYNTPANYNVRGRESERNVHIEMFQPDGKRIISQNGGIRISGNFTRQSEQKSFKIYGRKEYDAENRFEYPFFEDMRSAADGSIIDRFKSLKIRNTGNDRSEGFIRDELGLTLAYQAGFQDTQTVRPISVYINGVYQGLYWMHSTYDEEYFEERYGDYSGEMVVIGNSETNMLSDSGNQQADQCAVEYKEIYDKYSNTDLTEDSLFDELNQYIDVENYLQYYAIEVYMANRDWPFNNLQAYRYVTPDDNYLEDSVFDGRYRYLLYDVDTTMGLGSVRDSLNAAQSFETLVKLEEMNYAPLFTRLMKREDCRKYFAAYICDLVNGAFSAENVSTVLDEMHALRANEMKAYIEETQVNPDLPEISEIYLDMQRDCIKAWAEATPDNMLNGIQQLWQLGEIYSLHMAVQEGDGVKINSIEVTEPEFTGRYLTGCDTVISAIIPEGKIFSYWEINGEVYMEEAITIDGGMIIDGTVYVTLYTEEKDSGLVLSEIKSKGEDDYIVLTNTSEEEVSTWGYFLMDEAKASHMNYLENYTVAPGESILIGCKNYDASDSLMKVNFSLKKEKEVMLGHSVGGIIERVKIPDLGLEEGVYRKNMVTGSWKEEGGTADGT